jgi:OOP family OmpA-OmpF porin
MRVLLTSLALLALSPVARAAEERLTGFYVGGGVGKANVELEDSNTTADFKGDDTGFKLIAGYRIIDWLAVEANYADYGKPSDRIFGLGFEGDVTAFSISAIGMLPLDSVDLFIRGGISRWDAKLRGLNDRFVLASDDNVDPLFGLGAQLRFGNVAIRAEWEALLLGFDDDGDDEADGDDWADMVSVGATVRF